VKKSRRKGGHLEMMALKVVAKGSLLERKNTPIRCQRHTRVSAPLGENNKRFLREGKPEVLKRKRVSPTRSRDKEEEPRERTRVI